MLADRRSWVPYIVTSNHPPSSANRYDGESQRHSTVKDNNVSKGKVPEYGDRAGRQFSKHLQWGHCAGEALG